MEVLERNDVEEQPEKPNKKKQIEPGIIYLSRIPTLMGVKQIRHYMTQYGEVNRIFLQPNTRSLKFKKKSRGFTEGWVEFINKKIAKSVAQFLNIQKVGGKKRSKCYDELWNIKYLPKFKWAHLNERLAYEKAVHQQRMRTEITQAKKETHFFIDNLNESEKMKKKANKKTNKEDNKKSEESTTTEENLEVKDNEKDKNKDREWTFRQRQTDEEITQRKLRKVKRGKVKKNKPIISKGLSKSFLQNIFSGGLNEEES